MTKIIEKIIIGHEHDFDSDEVKTNYAYKILGVNTRDLYWKIYGFLARKYRSLLHKEEKF